MKHLKDLYDAAKRVMGKLTVTDDLRPEVTKLEDAIRAAGGYLERGKPFYYMGMLKMYHGGSAIRLIDGMPDGRAVELDELIRTMVPTKGAIEIQAEITITLFPKQETKQDAKDPKTAAA